MALWREDRHDACRHFQVAKIAARPLTSGERWKDARVDSRHGRRRLINDSCGNTPTTRGQVALKFELTCSGHHKGKGMRNRNLVLAVAALTVAGCTSVTVRPVAADVQLHNVCIVDNPQVIVSDFVPVLRDGFARHHIATSVVEQSQAQSCVVTLTYTALRSWDLKPYLSHAELRLWRSGMQIGFAEYHLNGKGGYDLGKWRGTKSKMDPVIDRLLATQNGG